MIDCFINHSVRSLRNISKSSETFKRNEFFHTFVFFYLCSPKVYLRNIEN